MQEEPAHVGKVLRFRGDGTAKLSWFLGHRVRVRRKGRQSVLVLARLTTWMKVSYPSVTRSQPESQSVLRCTRIKNTTTKTDLIRWLYGILKAYFHVLMKTFLCLKSSVEKNSDLFFRNG